MECPDRVGNAALIEDVVRTLGAGGQHYLAVTQVLEDMNYLVTPVIRPMLFRKQADGAGWNPTPCWAR
jgi:hypothetical protein